MLAGSKVSVSRVAGCEMASKGGSKGKGGLFPWITNQKGCTLAPSRTLTSRPQSPFAEHSLVAC